MQRAIAGAVIALVSAGIGRHADAQAVGDSTHRDTTAQAVPAVPVTNTGAPATAGFPADVRGYQLTDSVSLGDASSGKQYTYTRNKTDQINVFVAPYQPEDKLRTKDDTVNFVLDDVDRFYRTIQLAADQNVVIHRFSLLHRGSDDFRAHGQTLRGASVWMTFERRGTAGLLYDYYATYALPGQVVRVRAEIPAIRVRNEELSVFTKTLMAGMAPPQ